MVLCVLQQAERAIEAGHHKVTLAFHVVVEGALGAVQLGRDAFDRCAAIALLVDEPRGGEEKTLPRGLARLVLWFFQRSFAQHLSRRGEAVEQDVGEHTLDAVHRFSRIGRQPEHRTDQLRHHEMRARAEDHAVFIRRIRRFEDRTNGAEEIDIAGPDFGRVLFVQRAHVAEDHHLGAFARSDGAAKVEVFAHQPAHPRLAIIALARAREPFGVRRD